MSDATKMPTMLYFQWERPDAENPRLANPISATDTTIVVTNAALDEDSAVVTGSFIMTCEDKNGYVENIWVPAASSTDGLTFASVIRGIDLSGLDNTTQNTATLAVAHDQDDPVRCGVSGVNFGQMIGALQGTIASGGENWQIGNSANNDITIYAANGDANKPFWGYVAASNGWFFSNDGVNSTAFGIGAGVTGGDGISVTAGDIDIDITDTVIFRDSRNASEKIAVATAAADGLIALNFLSANLNEANTFFGASDITVAEAETLTDGSDTQGLHYHDPVDTSRISSREFYTIGDTAEQTFTACTHTDFGGAWRAAGGGADNQGGGREAVFYSGSSAGSVHDKNPEFNVSITLASAAAQDGFIGFVDDSFVGTSVEDNAMILDHVGFVFADAQVARSVANGATQTKTNVTCTLTDENVFRITFDGTTATFYINGASVGTETVNVPNSDLNTWAAAVMADATNASKTIYVKKDGRISFDNF